MTLEELDSLIREVEAWHEIREELNRNPKRKPLKCETLPKVLAALREYAGYLPYGSRLIS